jgi:hypothetical protein
VSSSPASEIVFSYNDPVRTRSTEQMTVIIKSKNNMYFFNYISDADRYYDYLPTVQKIIHSFRINDVNSSSNSSTDSSYHFGTQIKQPIFVSGPNDGNNHIALDVNPNTGYSLSTSLKAADNVLGLL